MTNQSCGTCRFRHYTGGCKRYPPPNDWVAKDDWCGEYQAAPEKPKPHRVYISMSSFNPPCELWSTHDTLEGAVAKVEEIYRENPGWLAKIETAEHDSEPANKRPLK